MELETSVTSRLQRPDRKPAETASAVRCIKKFRLFFPGGFKDETYIEWERGYKWETHLRWNEVLSRQQYRTLLKEQRFSEIAARAVRVEQRSRHSMLFSFEKMALRDAIKSELGARLFAEGLYEFLYSKSTPERRFENWVAAIAELPRRQTRVLTWPLVTVFGFIALPDVHLFLKPTVTRAAAKNYGFDFHYASKPTWDIYANLLEFAARIRGDTRALTTDLRPRDMIDLQSFIWVQGSDEYE